MPVKWTNLEYYGKKLKKHLMRIDGIIEKYYPDERLFTAEDITHYINCIETMSKIVKVLDKLVDSTDTVHRLERIEKLIEAIPVEQLIEAKQKLGV